MRTLIAVALLALTSSAAYAGNLQDQALGFTAQLNGNCSATLISSERDKATGEVATVFLTAKHCAEAAGDQYLDLPAYQNGRVVKKERYVATVRGKHYQSDLALIELKDKQTWFEKTAKIAPKGGIPAMGDSVVTVGYPLGLQLTVTAGLFGSLETVDYPSAGTEYYRATPNIIGGNSGGVMYRITAAGDYELIGVTSAGHKMFSFIGLYTPLDQIHAYLSVALPGVVGEAK